MNRRLIVLVVILFVGFGTLVVSIGRRILNTVQWQDFAASEADIQQRNAEVQTLRWLLERNLRLKRGDRDITPMEFAAYSGSKIEQIEFTSIDQVTSEVMKRISQLAHLKEVSFYDTEFGDDHIVLVMPLQHISELNLNYTEVTDAGLALIGQQFPKLEELRLNGTNITDDGIATLPRDELRVLTLYDTAVSDAALAQLAEFPRIGRLDVQKTKVTAEGLRRFQDAKQRCYVWNDPY